MPQIWRLLHEVDAVHGLYYLLMRPVLALHPGEVLLRLPSVLAAARRPGLVAALAPDAPPARRPLGRSAVRGQLRWSATTPRRAGGSAAMVAARRDRRDTAPRTRGRGPLLDAVRGGPRRHLPPPRVRRTAAPRACPDPRARPRSPPGVGGLAVRGLRAVALVLLPLALLSHAQSAQVGWLRPPGQSSVHTGWCTASPVRRTRMVDSVKSVYNFTWPEPVDNAVLSNGGRTLSGANQYGFTMSATRISGGSGIVGNWHWFNGAIVNIRPDGSLNAGPLIGRWSGGGQNYQLIWPKPVDTVTLAADHQSLQGGNQYGVPVAGSRLANCGR